MHNKESLLLSCIVHPQTKQLMFVSPEEMSHAKLLLFDKMTEIIRMNSCGSEKAEMKKVDEEMSDGGSKPVSQDQIDNDKKDSSKSKTKDSKDTGVDNDIGDGEGNIGSDKTDKALALDSEVKTERAQESSESALEERVNRDAGSAVSDERSGSFSVNVDKCESLVEDMTVIVQTESKTEAFATQTTEKVSESCESNSPLSNQMDTENSEKRKDIQIEIGAPEAVENTETKADNGSSDNPHKDDSKSTEDLKDKQNESIINEGIKEDSDKSLKGEKPGTDSQRTDSKSKLSSKTIKKSKVDTADWLEDVIGSGKSHNISPEQKAKVELDLYLAEPAVKTDALDWWKKKQSVFTIVSQVARSFLAIPASGISLEDVLNLNDDTIDAKKSQIDPRHLDALLFLNKNKGLLNVKVKS